MKKLKNWDNKTWLSSKRYILSINRFLKKNIKLNRNSKILDIGCGRGNIISSLNSFYKFKEKPIGLDIIKNNDIKKNIIFIKLDAIEYLRRKGENFDLILIKQTINFFTKKRVGKLIKLAKRKLNKDGKIFIFTLNHKNNEIPCFKLMKSNLEKSLKKDQNLISVIKNELKKLKMKQFNYSVTISKKNYVKMLKKRYISCLLNMPKVQLNKGIKEFSNRYKKQITFKDKLICIISNN
tara:strand:+ start:465 stop:1175 length:711 start_codon:yes stop_codon:yes gene_type:complete